MVSTSFGDLDPFGDSSLIWRILFLVVREYYESQYLLSLERLTEESYFFGGSDSSSDSYCRSS